MNIGHAGHPGGSAHADASPPELFFLVKKLCKNIFAKKYDGVTVNTLTMEAPQIKGPMVKRAPDFKKLTGANINVIGVPFSDIYPKMELIHL